MGDVIQLRRDEGNVRFAFPPNFKELDSKFRLRERGFRPVFSWGNLIYNPFGVELPKCIIAHECAHGVRQKVFGIEEWWRQYIDDVEFRKQEEIIGHQEELSSLVNQYGNNRHTRRKWVAHVAGRLCSPLYGYAMSREEAQNRLRPILNRSLESYGM